MTKYQIYHITKEGARYEMEPVFRSDDFTVADLLEEYKRNGYDLEDGETVDLETVEPTKEELAFLALGKDATKREAKGAVRRGVTVWDSVGEYLEMLHDNGIEPEGTPEEIKAGKFAGAGLVPVIVNGKEYLVEFVL